MRFGIHGLGVRFFVALAVLVGALALIGTVALTGLDRVQGANDQVYSDNFLTAETTTALALSLARVETRGSSIADAPGSARAAQLRAQLELVDVPAVTAAIAALMTLHRDDPAAERRSISRVPADWKQFLALARTGLLASPEQAPATDPTASAAAALRVLDSLVTFVAGREGIEASEAASAHAGAKRTFEGSRTWLLVAGAIALLAAIGQVRVGLTLRGLVGRQSEEQRYRDVEAEYVDTLQVTESEEEAQDLLRRHLERSLPAARAVVLTRNNSADRLEPKTSLAELDSLREALVGAKPRSCLAVRFARGHTQGGTSDPLMTCTVCGGLPGASDCEPLLVGGEVIGAVLVNQPHVAGEDDRRSIRDAVRQAAPVLGNLRNLAIAELRASTDALTGLPNQRAIQDTLKRMVAQASRTVSPLSALLIDLDHFKQINDLHGHERGDDVLAAVGDVLTNVMRESDFAGRYGGEEFLMLLPLTDRQGALRVAEATRLAIAAIRLPKLDQQITASVGVAVLPDDAGDSVTLFRAADRALYAAKRNGRNRVESAVGPDGSPQPDLATQAAPAQG
jgi:diguanylate cyclase (GGDEF)-like protein